MNKLQRMLNGSSDTIKANRSKIISESCKDAQEDIVREKKKELRDLEAALLDLTDLAPESELSLMVVKKDFNPEELFKKIHETKVLKEAAEIEVTIAQQTYDEWFNEESEEDA